MDSATSFIVEVMSGISGSVNLEFCFDGPADKQHQLRPRYPMARGHLGKDRPQAPAIVEPLGVHLVAGEAVSRPDGEVSVRLAIIQRQAAAFLSSPVSGAWLSAKSAPSVSK